MKQTGWRLIVKKVVDRTVAAGLLVATAPILGVAAAAVRTSMGAPVFFRQTRVGLHEKTFEIIKLRTMNEARGADGELLPDERRLTRLGQFLRATSIDELPQLLNVVRGELSLVGPRPLLPKYLDRYTEEERRRHDVLPGMSGWAIIHGRNAVDWDERLALDVWYVDHWSLLLDARILALTVRTVFARKGIAQAGHATMPNLPPMPVRQAAWAAAKRSPQVPIVKVLVTGAGALLGQGIIRSLIESSLSPVIVAADPSPLSAGLYWTRHRHLVPMASDPAYVEAFENILERERPDAVIPGTDFELPHFAENRARWEERFGTHVIISNPNVVRIANDKYLTYRFFRDHGFAAPDSCLPGEESALIERVGFPLIVKPRVGARSVGVVKVQTKDELARALATGDELVIQECVATERAEYTAGTLTFEGRCEASIVMRRDLRDGNTHRAYVEAFPELNVEVQHMAEVLGSHGPANFQFRLDAQGRAKVFEINARFSGTTPLRMRAGFNEVEMVLRRVLRDEPIKQPSVQPMTILRHLTETVVPAREGLS
jgi:carbamoyl-phosphate synthase large subunit